MVSYQHDHGSRRPLCIPGACPINHILIEFKITPKFEVIWFNPLHAKLFRVNLNMYLHFMSFLHIDMTQVLKILPQIR